jgi:hypothetical protein
MPKRAATHSVSQHAVTDCRKEIKRRTSFVLIAGDSGIAHGLLVLRVFVHRKANNMDIRVLPMNDRRRFDFVDYRHADVHQDNIRLKLLCKLDRLLTVVGMKWQDDVSLLSGSMKSKLSASLVSVGLPDQHHQNARRGFLADSRIIWDFVVYICKSILVTGSNKPKDTFRLVTSTSGGGGKAAA